MKKIIIAIIIAILSFANVNAEIQTQEEINKEKKVNIILNNYYDNYESKYGSDKSIKIFKNFYNKIIVMEDNPKFLSKKKIIRMITKSIYNIVLENQDNSEIITKTLGNGIYIKQNKYGLFGYTSIYAYGKKVYSDYTCNPFSFNCSYGENVGVSEKNIFSLSKSKIESLKNYSLKSYKLTDEGVENKNGDIKILIIYGYESVDSIIIDTKDKKLLTTKNDHLQGISKLIVGKSGIYFIDGGRGPSTLYMIRKSDNKLIKLFTEDEGQTRYLKNYELLVNKKVKLIFENGSEKIINIK